MNFRISIVLILLLLSSFSHAQKVDLFPLENVRLLESPFKHAQDLDLAYIWAMDPDRLLAPFLREAGLKTKNESYGNWENTGLDGHIGGHYLSALSLAYASTGEEIYKQRLDYMIGELKRVQDANGNGYIGGVPKSKELWQEIAKGEIRADLFGLNEHWVPWYNLHKTFAGLRDAYLLGKNEQALDILKKLGDWTYDLSGNLSDKQIQNMLIAEHGGMNEVLADYYVITGEEKYLALARKYSEHRILDPLLIPEDHLNGLHANTQIPKVVGFARIAQLSNDEEWHNAAEYFWKDVVNERTVAIGGNSVREHFNDKNDFTPMIEEIEGPETCNTYNMLKLSVLLYQYKGETSYVEFYEQALYNHILSSQNPDTGGLVYFTPMRPQHYRVYSQVDQAMWCCVGSGIENHLKYGEFIYAHDKKSVYVNLFIPSRLHWQEHDVILRQENALPDNDTTTITIEKGGRFSLKIRRPEWLAGEPELLLNGKKIRGKTQNNYTVIKRNWKNSDKLELTLPMRTRLEGLPDGSPYYAVVYGPVVLSAPVEKKNEKLDFFADDSRMGHIASAEQCSLLDAPMFISKDINVLDKIQRLPGKELMFEAPDLIGNTTQKLRLVPFFRVHDTRYMIYWKMGTKADLLAMRKTEAAHEQAKLDLDARTVDKVTPGEQQPEADHFYKGEQAEAGIHLGRHWRHTRAWFSYQLKNPNKEAKVLRLTFFGADAGRTFEIYLNGILIDTIKSDGSKGPVFVDVDYDLPDVVQKSTNIEFKLVAAPGSVAGGLFGLRLLK